MRLAKSLTFQTSNPETNNLIKELLKHDKDRINDLLCLLLSILSREGHGQMTDAGPSGPGGGAGQAGGTTGGRQQERRGKQRKGGNNR